MTRFKTIRNLLVIAGVLAGTGYLRLSPEQAFTEDLRERKIVQPRIKSETWSEMGQTSLAGTFGGLRSVMATFLSAGSYDHFIDQEWYDLRKDYEVITALDPYNSFYWEQGAWHLGFNAASWAKRNEDFSPAQRRATEMQYIELGDQFFAKGVGYNPDSHNLWFQRGALWDNEYKRPDLERAAAAFKVASQSMNPIYKRRYLFTLARLPGREKEAYDEMMSLLRENPRAHLSIPKFRCLMVVLGTIPDLPVGAIRPRVDQIFQTKESAYRDLYNYWAKIPSDGLYEVGLEEIMKTLISELNVPTELNPFLTKPKRPIYSNDWREKYRKAEQNNLPDWMLKEWLL